GSVTRWSMGEAEDLLPKYAWYSANSPTRSRPVGLLRPNDLGLFDLHGNAWEWCNNRYQYFMDMRIINTDDKVDDDGSGYTLRGGTFDQDPQYLRSASRSEGLTGGRLLTGFRPARTYR